MGSDASCRELACRLNRDLRRLEGTVPLLHPRSDHSGGNVKLSVLCQRAFGIMDLNIQFENLATKARADLSRL